MIQLFDPDNLIQLFDQDNLIQIFQVFKVIQALAIKMLVFSSFSFQISDDETEEKDEDSKQQSEVEEITEETEIPAEPCTPHCPGASGFPDLECTRCQSLFHSKCVGVEETDRSTFKCRVSHSSLDSFNFEKGINWLAMRLMNTHEYF